jgi:hypothetical protein
VGDRATTKKTYGNRSVPGNSCAMMIGLPNSFGLIEVSSQLFADSFAKCFFEKPARFTALDTGEAFGFDFCLAIG